MSDYAIVVAPAAAAKIGEYGCYIAEQSRSVEIAERWVDRVYDAIETLDVFPRRYGLAEEDAHRSYEVRHLVFGNYLVLYTVDDVQKTVKVVGFRHGARLPRCRTTQAEHAHYAVVGRDRHAYRAVVVPGRTQPVRRLPPRYGNSGERCGEQRAARS